jgi:hypothetical protein
MISKIQQLFIAVSISLLFTGCCDQKNTIPFGEIDITDASVIVSENIKSPVKENLYHVISEEIEKRTSVKWDDGRSTKESKNTIAIVLSKDKKLLGKTVPVRHGDNLPEMKAEGYRVFVETVEEKNTIWIIGADERGVLYGIGQILRTARMEKDLISIAKNYEIASSPMYSIRGHQLGYRHTANSWDAWTVEQYDQYIRDLVLFGSNCIENIPFSSESPHMKYTVAEMNVKMSEICDSYDADYWVWTPASFDLDDKEKRDAALKQHEEFYKSCPRLDGVFVPGGDPGHNHPKLVIPFLKDLAGLLEKYHREAGIWVSLQGFNRERAEYFFEYINKHQPDWLRGVVYGPSSPPIAIEDAHLPEKYLHRSYPDITHTVRCSYPTENWDQAYALTLGRECTNPQPYYYARVHNTDAPFTDGFLSYSDGCHDDVNKVIWSQMAWDSGKDPRDVLIEYCRYHFGYDVADIAADGILSLERNWDGSLIENGAVEATLELWKKLEKNNPELAGNWRWQMMVMRAYYDTYTRRRLIYEGNMEKEAITILENAKAFGADKAMDMALAEVNKADKNPIAQDLREKAVQYCETLFESIGLQTSVEKHQARGSERGCVLDFIDYPLNNRWWFEDEFKKIKELANEEEKLERIELIAKWENPGPGSFYDNISSAAKGPRVTSRTDDAIDYLWENDGFSRKRLSTQLFQFTPELEYNNLDTKSDYLIRVSGLGEALLRANGKRLKPTKYEKEFETFKEFPLPKELIKEGNLKITFDKPDEEHLNWRKQSRVTDVWLLKWDLR